MSVLCSRFVSDACIRCEREAYSLSLSLSLPCSLDLFVENRAWWELSRSLDGPITPIAEFLVLLSLFYPYVRKDRASSQHFSILLGDLLQILCRGLPDGGRVSGTRICCWNGEKGLKVGCSNWLHDFVPVDEQEAVVVAVQKDYISPKIRILWSRHQ